MEREFNDVGLTLQTTHRNNKILCRIVEGKPCTERALDDYIFVGSIDEQSVQIPNDIIALICEFISKNAGQPAQLVDELPAWRGGNYMYGRISVVNEDVQVLAQRRGVLSESVDPEPQKRRRAKDAIRGFAKGLPGEIDHFDKPKGHDLDDFAEGIDTELI